MAAKKENDEKKSKSKIIFSNKIDGIITGLALSSTFIFIAIFLYFKQDYFIIPAISHVISIICGLIGSMGFSIEIDNISNKPKGIGEIIFGGIFALVWYFLYICVPAEQLYIRVVLNILAIASLFLAIYFAVEGILKMFFSIFKAVNDSSKTDKKSIFSNVVVMLSRILGLILTAMNILNFFGIFENK